MSLTRPASKRPPVTSSPEAGTPRPFGTEKAFTDTGKIIRQALTIGIFCVLTAAAVHFPLVKRFLRGDFRTTFLSQAEYPGIRLITLEEAADLWARGGAVFFDARPAISYGEGHIPGARNLGSNEINPRIPFDARDILKEKTLVVYCEGGDCQSSLALAKRLHNEGFKDIRVMAGGWEEWLAAGLPEENTR